jgi:hypothetical protein
VQDAWQQAIDTGRVPEAQVRRQWIVARDERLCESCGPIPRLNPKIGVKHGQPFATPNGPQWLPPLHPNCRCTVFIRQYEPQQIAAAEAKAGGFQPAPPPEPAPPPPPPPPPEPDIVAPKGADPVLFKALEPMRAPAVNRAAEEAAKWAEEKRAALAAHNGNLYALHPEPAGGYPPLNSPEYNVYIAARDAARRKRDVYLNIGSFAPVIPEGLGFRPFIITDKAVGAYIDKAKQATSKAHDAFVAKMTEKAGNVVSANVSGTNVWEASRVTVTTIPKGLPKTTSLAALQQADPNSVETKVFNTKMIVNVSVLGKLFNQWPTTMKAKWPGLPADKPAKVKL